MSLAIFLVILQILLPEHLQTHKHSCNEQTFKVMHKHLYVVNFDNKAQTTRMKKFQIPDLKFFKTCICEED